MKKTNMTSKWETTVLILTLTMFVTMWACTNEKSSLDHPAGVANKDGEQRPPSSASRNLLPKVVLATLAPEIPASTTPLTVQYDGRGPENDPIKYVFRWFVDDALVQEGPNPMLEPGSYKKGSSVYVAIVPSNSFGQGIPFKSEPKKIGNIPPAVTTITLTPGKLLAGDVITALPAGEDPDSDLIAYSYQWTVNGDLVDGLSPYSNSFDTKGLKKKDMICVVVTPSDGESSGTPKLSEIIPLGNSTPKITSTPLSTLTNGVYTYQVTAMDPDRDRITYDLVTAPQGMIINPATGLIRWEAPQQITQRQEILVKIKADDGDGGIAYQEYSFFLEPR